jgi:hypothetical protein
MADIVFGFQRALYGVVTPPGKEGVLVPMSVGELSIVLGGVAAGSIFLLFAFWRVFFRMSGDFAEEL